MFDQNRSVVFVRPIRDDVLTLRDVVLESGFRVPMLEVHYRLEGALAAARDNLVVVVHALTGTVRVTEWWHDVVKAGGAIDPSRHAVLTANLLGGCDGTTGPRNDDPERLPPFTTRDQALVLSRVLDAVGVSRPLLVCGGSLGGQVTLEFAASFPDRVRAAVVFAAPAAQTALGLAWNAIMRRAVTIGGVRDGLALARMVGMISYRTSTDFERRFGRARSARGTFLVHDWLEAHGEKLVARFDATSYCALLDAMNTHDVGRGRGGVAAALSPLGERLTAVGVPGDCLYPSDMVREWALAANAHYVDLHSVHGHDAFLLEPERVSAILREALGRAHAPAAATIAPTVESAPVRDVRDVRERAHPLARSMSLTPAAPTLRVALAGCGHVGGNLLELLGERPADTEVVHVHRVLVRDAGLARPALARAVATGRVEPRALVTNPASLLDDQTDVLVEVIGGTTTARILVEAALRRGIRVVTANKALLAQHGAYLLSLARANGTQLDFEGAVAGAIPVVRCLRSGAAGVGVTHCSGILNGTSNFVLDAVADGSTLHDAIHMAQRLGYAEADPTRDLSGEDSEDKLRVLAWLIFGIDPSTLVVVRRGIDAATADWAAQVASEGDRVKLIAS